MYNEKIKTFYNEKMTCDESLTFSKSPSKPKLLVDRILQKDEDLITIEDFIPYKKSDFLIAHSKDYVNDVVLGKEEMPSSGIPWSKKLVESLYYTNASLYHAIENSYKNPKEISLSPVSGMHHATPTHGGGFCTFSGQAIASIKLYEKYKIRGAYIDLDNHFGNSIENTREFNPVINHAIPREFNVNIKNKEDQDYVDEFKDWLFMLEYYICGGDLDYIVYCHGADSCKGDLLGGSVNERLWFKCTDIFCDWIRKMNYKYSLQIPIILTLFGGYRENYNEVLDLHITDLKKIQKNLS